MYGGVFWWICVSSHRNSTFEEYCLQPDGTMNFVAVPMNQVGLFIHASRILKGGPNKAMQPTGKAGG